MTRNRPKISAVVLVVEDEPLVRMTVVDELEEADLQVLEAANADAALTVLEVHPEEVQVLFTDVNMPGSMDGMALAEQVHQRWPHIRLLISSGYVRLHPDEIPIAAGSCRSLTSVQLSCGTSPR